MGRLLVQVAIYGPAAPVAAVSMANLRVIEIVVGLGFGVYFIAKGLAILL